MAERIFERKRNVQDLRNFRYETKIKIMETILLGAMGTAKPENQTKIENPKQNFPRLDKNALLLLGAGLLIGYLVFK